MLILFGCTLFISAFLLFWCEPMVGKMVLPTLGGAASVWTTCVLFFQLMLLAGYVYAHFLVRLRRHRDQTVVHLSLMVLALVTLPMRISGTTSDASAAPVSWLLQHLLIFAGLPFATISATAPLLQHWLAKTRSAWGRDPYFLYSVSNAGSLLALAAFPVFIEPRYAVGAQSTLWRAGFGLVLGMIACAAVLSWKESPDSNKPLEVPDEAAESPNMRLRLYWLAAAFVPAALMLAVTNHISLNIGSFPFLWTVPLGIYLLTFILAFARKIRIPTSLVSTATTAVLLVLFPIAAVGVQVRSSRLWTLVTCHIVVLFLGSLLCHSSLADRRPASKYLTEFYFVVALGGVLGGVFAAIIAPALFSTIFEYPLLVAAILFFRTPGRTNQKLTKGDFLELTLFALFVAFAIFIVIYRAHVDVTRFQLDNLSGNNLTILATQFVLILIALVFRKRIVQFGLVFTILVVAYAVVLPRQFEGATRVYVARDFFGVKKVLNEEDINMRKLLHGDTMHGRESLDAELAGQPLSYYHRTGPIGDAMQLISSRPDQRVGVVGLGTGTIAAYAGPTRHITFFDIDPQVVDIARGFFSFLGRCADACDVVVGDGRLALQSGRPGEFDLLVIDAFNSDSIPAHLVSREAVRMYMSKLKPDGLLMFHVSNRYLDVERLASSVVSAEGLAAFVRYDEDETPPGKAGSHYLVALRRPEVMANIPNVDQWKRVEEIIDLQPWTDDFSNMLSIIRRP